MATSGSNRDVKMTLSVQTLGVDEVKKLETSITTLANEGGKAAPEFQRLAGEVNKLGQQAAALATFQKLADETAALAQKQALAAASVADLSAKLIPLATAAQAAATQQQKLTAEHTAARAALNASRDDLAKLTAATDAAGKKDAEYLQKVQALKLAKIAHRAEVERLAAALTAAKAETTKAEAEESKLASTLQRATVAAAAESAALRESSEAARQAAAAAQALGVSTTNVAAAQAALIQGLNAAGRAAAARRASIDEMRESDRLLLIQQKAQEAAIEKTRIALLAEMVAQREAEALTKRLAAARAAEAAAQLAANEVARKALEARREQAEADRLAIIQLAALARARQAGLAALEAERAAQRDAAKVLADYNARIAAAAAEQKRLADAALAAAQTLKNAFGTLGVRSAQELQAEIAKIRAAMDTVRASGTTTGAALNSAFASGEARIKALERELRAVNGQLTAGDRAASLFATSMGQITAGNIVADGVGYLVNKVKELGQAFLGAIVGGDQLQRGLMAVYKDAGVVASQLDFLRKSSSESGVAFGGLSKDFVKFSASMKSANIPLSDSNNLFKAVTGAAASLGLGVDATAGTLNALGQMASKGTVSMEELRAQLGDRLPGAIGMTAKGFGITEAQLVALVSSGQLATRDFIVPFTEGLRAMQGEVDGLVPAWERLKGFFSEMAQGAGDAGAVVLLTGALKLLGGFVGTLALGLSAVVEGIFLVGSASVAVAARLTGDTKAWDYFGEQVEKSTKRLTDQAISFNNFLEPATAATAVMTSNTAAVTASINANTSLSSAQKLAALSAALAADATLNASSKIVQYNVAATELISLQEKQTEAYAKLAKAAKEEGDTLVALAKLSENHEAITRASVVAAELHAAALDKVAKSQADETAMLIAQKTEQIESAKARGLTALNIKTQTDALEKLIVQSRAETEATNQASIAAKAEVFERQLAVKTLQDHSQGIAKYREAMEVAAQTLANYQALQKQGFATEEQVKQKRDELTTATVLYKDALADAIRNIDAETKAKQANLQLSIAQSGTAQKQNEILAAQARALGDTATATHFEIKAKEQAIVTMKLEMQMRALEAEAQKISIELKRLEITGDDDLSVKKRALLDVELALIKVKLQGNETAKEIIKGIENEISALQNGSAAWTTNTGSVSSNTGSIGGNTAARGSNTSAMQAQADALDLIAMKYTMSAKYTESQIALLDRLTAASERATAAENKRLNRDAEKFSIDPATGQRIGVQVDTRASVAANAKGQGLTDEQAKKISETFVTERGEKINWNPGGRLGAMQGETFSSTLQKAIDEQLAKNEKAQKEAEANPVTTQKIKTDFLTGAQTVTTKSPEATSVIKRSAEGDVVQARQTVNVVINGRSTPVNVASRDDATALAGILKQIEQASMRAS